MIYLDESAVQQLLPWGTLVDAIRDGMRRNDLMAPPRLSYGLGPLQDEGQGRLLIMPAWSSETHVGLKMVVYRPDNARHSLPTHGASYVLVNARSGVVEATIEAHQLTVCRTAAVSVLAAHYLARPSAKRLLVVGAGPVARVVAGAHAASRSLERLEIYGRNPERVEELICQLEIGGVKANRREDLEEGVRSADIISMATSSASPLIKGEWLPAGVHVDLIGSFTPAMREVDDDAIARADAVWVDTLTAIKESGDLVGPIAAGLIAAGDIKGDLRTLVSDDGPKRTSESGITVFKAVGLALCDFAVAQLLIRQANEREPIPSLRAPHSWRND